jgi:hypothetical protein
VAPFSDESLNIHSGPRLRHLHLRCCHPSPFIPHSTSHFSTQTWMNTTPKKKTTHSIDAVSAQLATAPTPMSLPSTWTTPLATSCLTLHPLPQPSASTLPCRQTMKIKNQTLPPLPWDASLQGLLGQYLPQTQISMPVSSARS